MPKTNGAWSELYGMLSDSRPLTLISYFDDKGGKDAAIVWWAEKTDPKLAKHMIDVRNKRIEIEKHLKKSRR